MLFIFQFTDILKIFFFWNSLNQQVLQKLENDLDHFITFLEQAWHNQMDDGEHGCQNWRDYEGSQKSTFFSIIVLDSE